MHDQLGVLRSGLRWMVIGAATAGLMVMGCSDSASVAGDPDATRPFDGAASINDGADLPSDGSGAADGALSDDAASLDAGVANDARIDTDQDSDIATTTDMGATQDAVVEGDSGTWDYLYDFESLRENGAIGGQDNWVDQPKQGSAAISLDDTDDNGSLVVTTVPTVVRNETAYLTRANNDAFDFEPFAGHETEAIIQYDVDGNGDAAFALGRERTGDGMLKEGDGEIGPSFGPFFIRGANLGTRVESEFPAGDSKDDWYQVQLRIDFTANDGEGAGSLYYRNLTKGDASFQAVAGVQSVDLQLSRMHADATPATWNALWLAMLADGSRRPRVDNLIAHLR